MFALIADDTLYFKADADSQADFASRGLKPFEYKAKGEKRVVMAYWRAPEDCLDDPAEMRIWADRAFAAALRAGRKKIVGRKD
jgi:DNA transformation protein